MGAQMRITRLSRLAVRPPSARGATSALRPSTNMVRQSAKVSRSSRSSRRKPRAEPSSKSRAMQRSSRGSSTSDAASSPNQIFSTDSRGTARVLASFLHERASVKVESCRSKATMHSVRPPVTESMVMRLPFTMVRTKFFTTACAWPTSTCGGTSGVDEGTALAALSASPPPASEAGPAKAAEKPGPVEAAKKARETLSESLSAAQGISEAGAFCRAAAPRPATDPQHTAACAWQSAPARAQAMAATLQRAAALAPRKGGGRSSSPGSYIGGSDTRSTPTCGTMASVSLTSWQHAWHTATPPMARL
mmetsp:Transcript_6606/g.16445  ORF Transcript_6606/g.16445 Transcript_6606/m.16445 type:complete len:306 (+) Transcript_6606:41-958(+)